MSIADIYVSGGTTRYHTHSIMNRFMQTNADHQARATKLLIGLHKKVMGYPPHPHLMQMVLHHDVAEKWVGDLPLFFKLNNPEMARQHREVETAWLRELGLGDLIDAMTDVDWFWLELVDKLEAYLFIVHNRPDLMNARDVTDLKGYVSNMAQQIGPNCWSEVRDVMRDVETRNHV